MMKRMLAVLVLAACITAPALAMTTDSASIVALIKATPGLAFDRTVTAPAGFDPKAQPYVKFTRSDYELGGFLAADYASIGTMDGGLRVMAVPLDSGGSGGVFTQLIFVQGVNDARPFYAGAISSGGHLGVNVTFHGIVAIYPKSPLDPNCCPKHFAIETYTIAGHTLKRVATRLVSKP